MSAYAPSYAFHGLDIREQLLLKSMVDRAARHAGRSWRLSLAVLADCVIYQGERPRALRTGTLLVRATAAPTETGGFSLVLPPRLQDVAALLAALEQRLQDGGAEPDRPNGSWHELLALIQQHIARGESIALVDAQGRGWTILPRERRYTACGEGERAPTELAGSSPAHWRLIEAPASNGRPVRALDALLWQLGIEAGGEGVLASIGDDRPMRLRAWPNLPARAPARFGEFAALLRQTARSARAMQRAAAASSPAEVAGFYNACALCGFLAPAELAPFSGAYGAPPGSSAARAQRFSRFLGALRHALGIPA